MPIHQGDQQEDVFNQVRPYLCGSGRAPILTRKQAGSRPREATYDYQAATAATSLGIDESR